MKLRKRDSDGGLLNRSIKNPMVQYAGIISYIILILMRIPLSKVIGDAGIGLFAPAYEIFFLITIFTSYCMTKAMSGIIRYRVKRDQYKNAKRAFRAAFSMDLLISVVLALLLLLMSKIIADIFVLESFARMAVMEVAPVIIFAAFIGTFRGYFDGYGLGVLTAHSQYIESISMVVCVFCFGDICYIYGTKVAALRQDNVYSYAYGALGAMLGVMVSQIITTIHLLVVYVVYSGTLRGKLGMDGSKRLETQYSLQGMVLRSSLPFAVSGIISNLYMLIDQRMFNYCMNKRELGPERTGLWGCYYGKCAVLISVGAALGVWSVYTAAGRISNAYERGDYRIMRERIGKAVRRLCIVAFPTAIYLAALARAFAECLYKGGSDALTAWVQKGAVIIILYGCCFLFGQLMYRVHMIRELLFTAGISLIVHVLTAYILVQKALLGADGIVYALILSFAVCGGLNFFLVSRNLKYKQEWLGGIVFPAAAAGVSGVVVALLSSFLLEPLGGMLTLLIGIVAGLFIYVTFLMILRVIGEAELSRIPLGFFFIMLGRNLGIL
ncbi:MAG: polysaccharide biosynthesis C-terminal domain-containing protein [Lachnospiraceae bacterium]|nr:polysaccharide biosynthesis C-terminal domain-containing protein [Lachnospiraceae bacterium]